MRWLSLGSRKMWEKFRGQGYHGVSLEKQWILMYSLNLGGVQEWLERWMKKSGNLNLKILIIRKMTLPMWMMRMKKQF